LQQQAAAMHAQQQAAFHQYQAALEARLMMQQHHGHPGRHEDDGEEEDGQDGRDEDQEEGSLENGEQLSASLDDAAPPPDQMNHGRSRTPGLMYNGLYPAPELQHSELGSLGILLQDEMNANALNNQALHEAAGQRTQRERQRVPFHPATGGFGRGAGEANVPMVMSSVGDGVGGGPTGPNTSLGYSLSGPPMMPKAPMPVENLAGCNCKKSRCLKL
jgi:hypothetical protein